jgi:hypothetical protein
MIDKIMQLGGLPGDDKKSNRVEKKVADKKVAHKESKQSGRAEKISAHEKTVQVDISSSAKELLTLRAEAERYLKHVELQEGISSEEVKELKEKIAQNYYLKEEIIDKIVDKLLDLPGLTKK